MQAGSHSSSAMPMRIGTRGSPLALYQARLVQSLLGKAENIAAVDLDVQFPIIVLKTTGDRITDRRLIEAGGKGLFTRELEEALLDGRIDLAVHSMKDVPTIGQSALDIAAILPRADVRDGFISLSAKSLLDLPKAARIGTASIRRQAQVMAVRPDITFTLLRGNVGTRLEKLKAGECDATFLAAAGLLRLGMESKITDYMPVQTMLPAPAQGAIGIEIPSGDGAVRARLSPLNDEDTRLAISAERAFLRALDGSCRTPIAALAIRDGNVLHFRGQAFTPGGQSAYTRETRVDLGAPDKAAENALQTAIATGNALGREIRAEAGDALVWDTFGDHS